MFLTIKVDLSNCSSDEDIIMAVKKMPNGPYCTTGCKKCGSYLVNPEGNIKDIIIENGCRDCR